MKKIVLIAALTLTTTTSAFAAEDNVSKYCPGTASIAKIIMEVRQEGVPLRRAMEASDLQLVQNMVVDAYGYPKYQTEEVRDRTIQEFEDKWYLNCVKALSK